MFNLSILYPVNSYLFLGASAGVILCGAWFARAARASRVGPWWKRWGLWSAAAILITFASGLLLSSRTVGTDDVGIGRSEVYDVGTYVWARERFVAINRNGSFLIPYPNERIFLLVEYKVKDPVKLKGLYEELMSHRAGLGKEHFLGACGLDVSWKHGPDPLASWLQSKVRDRMPTNPTQGENYLQYSLEPVFQVLLDCGITARVSLVRKDLLRSI